MKNFKILSLALVACLVFLFQPTYSPAVALDTGPGITIVADVDGSPVQFAALDARAGTYSVTTAEYTMMEPAYQDDPGTVVATSFLDILKANWKEILFALIAFFELIVRLTPTTKDNSILSWVTKFLNLIFPNRKSGGGVIVPLVRSQQK